MLHRARWQISGVRWNAKDGHMKMHGAWGPGTFLQTTRTSCSLLLILVGMGLALVGCAKQPIAYQATTPPPCQKPAQMADYGAFPLRDYLPLPVEVLEDKFRHEPFDILEAKSTAHGSSGALRFKAQFRDCTVVTVKWHVSPPEARAYNNDPRRELAAYAIQKLFLDPKDYVVPVTVLVCVPVNDLSKTGLHAPPQSADMTCVAGPVAVWLKNVNAVRNFLDRERFERSVSGQEKSDYARDFANLNIFTYLISHRDGRKGNFLVSTLPKQSRIFSIDNGLAFGGIGNPRPFVIRWGHLKVKKLPRETVARLRTITPEQLQQILGTLAEHSIAPDGSVSLVPASENLNPEIGFRRQGNIVQIGLTAKEIAGIETRLRKLLERVDSGDIQLF
jgi:hypothetical protein